MAIMIFSPVSNASNHPLLIASNSFSYNFRFKVYYSKVTKFESEGYNQDKDVFRSDLLDVIIHHKGKL